MPNLNRISSHLCPARQALLRPRLAARWATLFAVVVMIALPICGEQQSTFEVWLTAGKYAYVLDEKGQADAAKIEVGENAYHSALSHDGKLVAIASFGLMDDYTNQYGATEWWPKKNSGSFITILKRPGGEVVGKYPVRFRPYFVEFTSDNARLIICSLGQYSRNEKKNLSPQIALIDVATGKITGNVEFAFWNGNIWHVPAANRLILGGIGEMGKDKPDYQLISYDIASGTAERTKLPSEPREWYDSGLESTRYLRLEQGVAVVDSQGKLVGAPISAGKYHQFFIREPIGNRYFLAGKTDKQGKLLVIEGGRVIKSMDFPPLEFVFFDPEADRIFVCPDKLGIVLDAKTFEEVFRIPLPGRLFAARVGPDKRLYAIEYGGRVTVIDLQEKREVAKFTSGRGGVKFGIMLLGALADTLNQMQARMTNPYAVARPVEMPLEIQNLAFSPSGKFVFVYNTFSSDVTVVETDKFTVLRKEPTGHTYTDHVLWQLSAGRQLLSCASGKVLIFDTDKGEPIVMKELKGSEANYDPALGKILITGAAGTEVYKAAPFEKVSTLAPGKSVLFKPDAGRFLILSENKVSLYDFDLHLLRASSMEPVPRAYPTPATVAHVFKVGTAEQPPSKQ